MPAKKKGKATGGAKPQVPTDQPATPKSEPRKPKGKKKK